MPYKKPDLLPNQFAVYAISRMKNITWEPNVIDGVVDTSHPKEVSSYINAYIPITFFDGEQSSYFSIYDENLQIKENAQYSFSFSVAKFVNGELNPIFYLLTENRRLRLQTYYQKIDFIITSITPQITNQNIIYQITCQDVFSYDLSKQNMSITYEPEIPADIRTLGDAIIEISKLGDRWRVDSTLESGYYADFPALQQVNSGTTRTPIKMKATLSISGSTPYNALVELAKKFNANISVEYSDDETKPSIIYFNNTLLEEFQGYMLRPDVNMSAFSVARKTDSFCSIMHVSGGEDVDGNIVSMCPVIPSDVQKYFVMMYPHRTDVPTDVFKTLSSDYCVIEDKDGNYTLYQRSGSTYVLKTSHFTPWTLMTAEEIEADFNRLTLVDGKKFASAGSNEVANYFNFLKYRAKTGSSMFYDFSYYKEVGLMDELTSQDIERTFSRDLRNANIILFCVSYQYNMLTNQLQRYVDKEEEYFVQLAALEEEWYLYETGAEKTPETVLGVLGATEDEPGALNRTTIYEVIDNEKLSVLNKLQTEIWIDEYYRLLFTLKGADALEQKLKELSSKLDNQEKIFETNFEESWRILDTQASTGTITLKSIVPAKKETDTFVSCELLTPVDVKDSENQLHSMTHAAYIQSSDGKFNLYLSSSIINTTTAAYLVNYDKAVIKTDKDASSGFDDWPTEGGDKTAYATLTLGEYDSTYHSYPNLSLTFYHNRNVDSGTCQVDIFNPKIASTRQDREEYLSNKDHTYWSDYCVCQTRYKKALNYIEETPNKTDKNSSDSSKKRRGLYKLQHDYWSDAIEQRVTDPYGYYAAKHKYATPYNLLEWLNDAKAEQSAVWTTIYSTYGDFIAETTFTDADQLSSEGLFMAAMQAFTKYSRPTYEYSTTVINTNAIANIQDKGVNIGDIVYVYNKDISTQFANKIRVTIPREKGGTFYKESRDATTAYYAMKSELPNNSVPYLGLNSQLDLIQGKCKLFNHQISNRYVYPYGTGVGEYVTLKTADLDDANNSLLDIASIEVHDNYIDIILHCSITQATSIMTMKATIDAITLYPMNVAKTQSEAYQTTNINSIVFTNVLDIQMEENVKPIPLQITGVTKKLREATSQLTVSTDRTMDLVFQRLIKQARL